jgi:hypothetical protein
MGEQSISMFRLDYLLFFSLFLSYSFIISTNALYEKELYQIALRNYEEYRSLTNQDVPKKLEHIHLVRIPKAGSSSFSVVARRIVGCEPPGPCCRWPGDPVGSCPSKDLFDCQLQRKVIGCTGHNPEFNILKSGMMSSVSMIRDPLARSISAFFYPNHHNMECQGDLNHCFQLYMKDNRFQNIAVKMLCGDNPYMNHPTCRNISQCRHSLEMAIHNLKYFQFFGIMELWELSLLLFHFTFPQLPPSVEEFSLYSPASFSNSSSPHHLQGIRENTNANYSAFKETARELYAAELLQQNHLDIELYKLLKTKFHDQLIEKNLWDFPIVQDYWKEKLGEQKLSTPLAPEQNN